jgi:hypothetical protein
VTRWRRGFSAGLALVLLLLNAVGPALGNRPMAAQESLGDGQVVICTSHGAMVVEADGAPAPRQSDDRHDLCGFCLPLSSPQSGALATQAAALPLPSRTRGMVLTLERRDSLHTPAPRQSGTARGPPATA